MGTRFKWLRSLFHIYKTPHSTSTNYNDWSKSQLIAKIMVLEKKPGRIKKQESFDITQYQRRRIALKVAYMGWNYSGFVIQDREKTPTVESKIFEALKQCRLVDDISNCNYTRCGRTDKGVSGLGQVIALDVRSSRHKKVGDIHDDIPYIQLMNRLLPEDIRVLAWAPVQSNFNARFDCRSRTYKYYFEKQNLDIELMRVAANLLVGSHDFRNFCKLDPSKNIKSYVRHVFSVNINPIPNENDMYEVEIKGRAFLWHQVRYIMSILFLIGQRLESPDIISDLFDIENVKSKPDYSLANALPLLLYDCEYDDIQWRYATQPRHQQPLLNAPVRTYRHWESILSSYKVKSMLYETCLQHMKTVLMSTDSTVRLDQHLNDIANNEYTVVLGAGTKFRAPKYQAVLTRPRCDTDEIKKEKYRLKQLNKLQG
ncbi:pseudouridine synthase [Pilobolus umbonatus]|nr:pseudouridine synthase [Pilobolus umbonatus]